jgi:hypothetical protein
MPSKALSAIASIVIFSGTLSVPAVAEPISFDVPLTGTAEVPPAATQGKGEAKLTWDPASRKVTWQITATGLSGPATMAHFHQGPPKKNWPGRYMVISARQPCCFPNKGRKGFDA